MTESLLSNGNNNRERIMKRTVFIIMLALNCGLGFAQSQKKDSITSVAENIYKSILPVLDRIEFSGSCSASQEIERRWKNVINHLKNNQGTIAEDVKNMLVTPSGIPVDLEMIKKFIQITEDDSIRKISINPDFFLDEMKEAAEKVKAATKGMAKKR